jgi:hypothetical protein
MCLTKHHTIQTYGGVEVKTGRFSPEEGTPVPIALFGLHLV